MEVVYPALLKPRHDEDEIIESNGAEVMNMDMAMDRGHRRQGWLIIVSLR